MAAAAARPAMARIQSAANIAAGGTVANRLNAWATGGG